MTLPSFLNEKAIKQAGIISVALFALWILWQVVISGQVALTQDVQDVQRQGTTIIDQNDDITEKIDQGNREQQKQTILLQQICINGSETQEERKDCILLEP